MKKAVVRFGSKKLFDALYLDSPFERARGLMFAGSVQTPLILPFATESTSLNAIHSFFCPVFDAVFLDARGVVVDVIPRVAPNNPFIASVKPAKYVIELHPGQARKIRKGQKLVFRLTS